MRGRSIIGAILVMAALVAVGCGGGSGKHTITGGINILLCDNPTSCEVTDQVQPGSAFAVGKPCEGGGTSGYSDIAEGAQVTIKDQTGALIASGRLGAGTWVKEACKLPFTISSVPSAKFYSIEVTHRGAQTYSSAELAAKKYDVELTLAPLST